MPARRQTKEASGMDIDEMCRRKKIKGEQRTISGTKKIDGLAAGFKDSGGVRGNKRKDEQGEEAQGKSGGVWVSGLTYHYYT